MVIKENGMPVLRQAVRIAKKSLVFSEPVDGKTEVVKNRCYFYSEEYRDAYIEYKSLTKKMLKINKRRQELLDNEFNVVKTKTTAF